MPKSSKQFLFYCSGVVAFGGFTAEFLVVLPDGMDRFEVVIHRDGVGTCFWEEGGGVSFTE